MAGASPRRAVLRAPAKVNLALRVLGRRPDGYHDLDSLMFPVGIYDTVELEVRPARRERVRCAVTGPEKVPGGAGNLAARAASAVLRCLGETAEVGIRLHKDIPHGAGLGGGSSDAAAVIRALPRLLGRRLGAGEALSLARGLGADVPFFLACRPARATGIGDRLRALARVPRGHLVVVVPPERVDTSWAYRHALQGLTSCRTDSSFRALPRNIDAVEAWFLNDFQRGVEAALGSVREAREGLLELGARAAVMSGSGSAVVGYFEDGPAARLAAGGFPGPGRVFVCRILRRAPVSRSTPGC